MSKRYLSYRKDGTYFGNTRICRPDPITRIFMKTEVTDTCWLYKGAINSWGYGSIRIDGKTLHVHRFLYETFFGPLGKNQLCCHTCDVPNCINPAHIFIGSSKDNSDDMRRKNRAAIGSKQGKSKLKEDDIIKIFLLRKEGTLQKEIAKLFGVTPSIINLILNRKIWKHVEVNV